MALTVTYSDSGLKAVFTGHMTGDDIFQLNEELYKHAFKFGLRYQFVDFSGVETYELSNTDARRIAEQDAACSAGLDPIHFAIVGAKDLIFGLSRMWETYMNRTEHVIKVFRSTADAENWLKGNGFMLKM